MTEGTGGALVDVLRAAAAPWISDSRARLVEVDGLRPAWRLEPDGSVDCLRITLVPGAGGADCFLSDARNEYESLEIEDREAPALRTLTQAVLEGRATLRLARFLGRSWLRSVEWDSEIWSVSTTPLLTLLPQHPTKYQPY
ncbi:hypothetical protein AB0P21_13395 [Kribbella sp. NPDC056861]|uniref:hypothetical protein n=1 Tax=Kribbella sp. NPDC056861 TaxID=3154857 RepID=UPI00342B87FA